MGLQCFIRSDIMDNRLIINQPLQPIRKTDVRKEINQKTPGKDNSTFSEIFAEKLMEQAGIRFSKHAQNRIISRGIKLDESDLGQLKNGMEKAEGKGAKDSLIMVNKVAYVVSIENKTVITAINGSSVKENVFTNIDSAVFM
jgi:flagellar operon protein